MIISRFQATQALNAEHVIWAQLSPQELESITKFGRYWKFVNKVIPQPCPINYLIGFNTFLRQISRYNAPISRNCYHLYINYEKPEKPNYVLVAFNGIWWLGIKVDTVKELKALGFDVKLIESKIKARFKFEDGEVFVKFWEGLFKAIDNLSPNNWDGYTIREIKRLFVLLLKLPRNRDFVVCKISTIMNQMCEQRGLSLGFITRLFKKNYSIAI